MDDIRVDWGFLAVKRLDEAVDQRFTLSAAEQAYAEKITNSSRRAEWLAWHAMLREKLREDVSADYNAAGQPVLIGHPGHISVSHSREFVVLYYQPGPCGVDIEEVTRNFDQTSDRFISPAEQGLAASVDRFPALVWCAKEAVYKCAGRPGLDLLRDIRLVRIDPDAREIRAVLLEKEDKVLRYRFFDDHCLVYTV